MRLERSEARDGEGGGTKGWFGITFGDERLE